MATKTSKARNPETGKMNVNDPDLSKAFIDSLTPQIGIKDAARLAGVQPRTMRSYLDEGRIEGAYKVGSQWIIPRDAAIAFAKTPRPVGSASWKTPEESEARRIAAVKAGKARQAERNASKQEDSPAKPAKKTKKKPVKML
jgi:hypothetical protein